MALIAHPHVIGLDAAFVFHPLRPLGNLARSHDEPAEETFWEGKDLVEHHEKQRSVFMQGQPFPSKAPSLLLFVDAWQHDERCGSEVVQDPFRTVFHVATIEFKKRVQILFALSASCYASQPNGLLDFTIWRQNMTRDEDGLEARSGAVDRLVHLVPGCLEHRAIASKSIDLPVLAIEPNGVVGVGEGVSGDEVDHAR